MVDSTHRFLTVIKTCRGVKNIYPHFVIRTKLILDSVIG